MERLPHGYTNFTRLAADGVVEKEYVGPRRFGNVRREHACLIGLADKLPVPEVVAVDFDEPRLLTRWVDGEHGQDLIDAGQGPIVMRLLGETLRALQSIRTADVDLAGDGTVISHGDFGAQNMLFDLSAGRVAAIIDWESAHIGAPIDDLAFAEWIVRMHHADKVEYLDALFSGAGWRPPWEERRAVMLRKCDEVRMLCEEAGWTGAAGWWRDVTATTEGWAE